MGFADLFGLTPRAMSAKLVNLEKINEKFVKRLQKMSQRTIDILEPDSLIDLEKLHTNDIQLEKEYHLAYNLALSNLNKEDTISLLPEDSIFF